MIPQILHLLGHILLRSIFLFYFFLHLLFLSLLLFLLFPFLVFLCRLALIWSFCMIFRFDIWWSQPNVSQQLTTSFNALVNSLVKHLNTHAHTKTVCTHISSLLPLKIIDRIVKKHASACLLSFFFFFFVLLSFSLCDCVLKQNSTFSFICLSI